FPMFDWFRPARGRMPDRAFDDGIIPSKGRAHAPEKKSGLSPLIALSLAGRARWGGRDFASLARQGYMCNAVGYACVRRIASAAASVPWLLYEGQSELDTHPLLALLARPNPQEDGTALFERWYAFLQCAGNAYLEASLIENTPR